ncbi:VOC family protein [Cellulomonas sp.]|uniref:VOC family protein n=1 Tax=Cellulomonas sp. TaxID=40001 RepID=UPI001B0B7E4C|nr:VOC family protein [Cellulomonas sp.]MBO9556286.1 VOC family protein [Cellulomonas sp.]
MSITTTTHLNFRGDARAALELYREVFGGELALVTYRDAHAVHDPSDADHVMWGEVRSGHGFHVMAYDVPTHLPYDAGVNPVFVSVRGTDPDEITARWKGLSAGATVVQDLAPAGWSPLYGMLRDRFGVVWVLDVVAS